MPFVELSHVLASMVGVALLFLARGLQRRLDSAYHVTLVLLAAGIVFSLTRGGDIEAAVVLIVVLAVLVPVHPVFYRTGSLIRERFSPAWIATIGTVVAASMWLGLFSFKHVEYSRELWWQFALDGDASRFLRATAGVVALGVGFAIAKLLAPSAPDPRPADADALRKAAFMVARSPDPEANLALLGDKSLLFNDDASGFVMFGVQGRSWVAMGGPVAPDPVRGDLAWRFRTLVDRHDGWPVFYQVGPGDLDLCVDLGLTLVKLGEEAIVPLETFSLEGGSREPLRRSRRQAKKEGCTFGMIDVEDVPAILPELRAVSDRWLAARKVRERRFSLGYFDESYLGRYPHAVVRRGNAIVAFANVWIGSGGRSIAIDLLRHTPDAPDGVMDFLFTELMSWGKECGCATFSLGMSPLPGVQDRALAPLWNRLGAFVFRHGEEFYDFQGLRRYKDRFDPRWEPRFLASPGGLALPAILVDVATLIAGGAGSVVLK